MNELLGLPYPSNQVTITCGLILMRKVKSFSHACLFATPMDWSPPGSSVHGIFPSKNTGVGCHFLLQGIFPTQGLSPGLPHCRQMLCPLMIYAEVNQCIPVHRNKSKNCIQFVLFTHEGI